MSSFKKQKPSMPSQSNHCKSASLTSSSSSQQQPIINYEEYLETNHNFIDKELANVLLFPSDEIQLIEIKKKFSTIEQLKPECEIDVDHNINDCLRSYNSNYKCIVKK